MCFCLLQNICLSFFCAALEGGGDWFAMFFAGIHESTRAFNFFLLVVKQKQAEVTGQQPEKGRK
jgi:hypothetical protein